MTLKVGSVPEAAGRRRRGGELEEALLTAAWTVLVRDGYSGLTFEAVAQEANTGRAVLYRRWPQRPLMLEAALRRFWVPIDLPDTGSLRADAIALLGRINESRADVITVLGVKIADYFRDTGTTLAQLRDIIGLAEREEPFAVLVERAVARGELDALAASPRITNLPLDLLRHDMMMRSGPLEASAITEIVDDVWLPLLGAVPRR